MLLALCLLQRLLCLCSCAETWTDRIPAGAAFLELVWESASGAWRAGQDVQRLPLCCVGGGDCSCLGLPSASLRVPKCKSWSS